MTCSGVGTDISLTTATTSLVLSTATLALGAALNAGVFTTGPAFGLAVAAAALAAAAGAAFALAIVFLHLYWECVRRECDAFIGVQCGSAYRNAWAGIGAAVLAAGVEAALIAGSSGLFGIPFAAQITVWHHIAGLAIAIGMSGLAIGMTVNLYNCVRERCSATTGVVSMRIGIVRLASHLFSAASPSSSKRR